MVLINMEMLSTLEEFKNYSARHPVLLKCQECHLSFTLAKNHVLRAMNGNRPNTALFCSRACCARSNNKRIIVLCANCGNDVSRKPSDVLERNFCSRSCSAKYNNAHKKHGTRRSKIEIYIQNQIIKNYPQLCVVVNDQSLGFELDFLFPDLKFAIEFNGPVHYEPIYGLDKFLKIQNKDQQKVAYCREVGIELCVIDISQVKNWTESKLNQYWEFIDEILCKINNRRAEDSNP